MDANNTIGKIVGQIYKITNKINGKMYIGYTTKTIEERWYQHVAVAFNKNSKDYNAIFKKAIRKYGVDNFKIEAIDSATSLEELKLKEIMWIDKLNTYAFSENSCGYNATYGGDGTHGFGKAVLQIDALSGVIINTFNSLNSAENYIGHKIGYVGSKNHYCSDYCFLFKDNVNNLNEIELTDYVHSLYPYLVYQLDINGEIINLYKNTLMASQQIQCSIGNMIMACLGYRRVVKEYQWAYQKDINDRIHKPPPPIKKICKQVIRYSKFGEMIDMWDSISEASKALSILDSHLSQCCKHKRTLCGGYQWRYASENITELPPIKYPNQVKCVETNEIFEDINHAAKHFSYSHATVKKSCEGAIINKPLHFIWC